MAASKLFFKSVGIGFLSACITAFGSTASSSVWKSDCVGRMQLSFPDEVEVAGSSFKELSQQIANGYGQQKFQFDDGEITGWSNLRYGSDMSISNTLSNDEISALKKRFFESKDKLEILLKNSVSSSHRNTNVGDIDSGLDNVSAWNVSTSIRTLIQLDQHLLSTTVDEKNGLHESLIRLQNLAKNIQLRTTYFFPDSQGVCLPFAFIKDDGAASRNIAMTYRLKTHPDVTIWLEDSSAADYDEPIRIKNAKPEYRLTDFWQQYEYSRTAKKVDSIWKHPAAKPIKIAGQEGLASFVQITRKDNSIDYGYFVAVRGDPNAKQDTPDLRFYVIREAAHAKAKGIEPIDEKEFLNLAQTIANSIKHHAGDK